MKDNIPKQSPIQISAYDRRLYCHMLLKELIPDGRTFVEKRLAIESQLTSPLCAEEQEIILKIIDGWG